jgi:hypothetical protein
VGLGRELYLVSQHAEQVDEGAARVKRVNPSTLVLEVVVFW